MFLSCSRHWECSNKQNRQNPLPSWSLCAKVGKERILKITKISRQSDGDLDGDLEDKYRK